MCLSVKELLERKVLLIGLVMLGVMSLGYPILAQTQEIDITSAVADGRIQADVRASGNSFYGPGTLIANLTNQGTESLTIVVPQGLRFRSLDTAYQDEIVAVTERIPLQPGQTVTTPLTSFCGNAHRAAPVAGNEYAIGEMEPARMRHLLSEIEQQNLQDNIQGQWAVWGETDDMPAIPEPDFGDILDLLDSLNSQGVARQVADTAPTMNGALIQDLGRQALLKTLLPYLLAALGLLLLALLLWWLLRRRRVAPRSAPARRSGSYPDRKKPKQEVKKPGSSIRHGRAPSRPKSSPPGSKPIKGK